MKFEPLQKLTSQQKTTLLWILGIGIVYFAIFIPANLTGAANADMLSIFEVDEYAQYPSIAQMLTPGDSLLHTLRNFLVYSHYFYGYPFYFASALSVLPLRLIWGNSFSAHTPAIMLVMRQMVNVFPAIMACGLFTWMATQFKDRLKSLALFVLLLLVPGLVLNNMWWHPDSIELLLAALVFFFLQRDRQNFSLDFYAAALFCGVAVGIKYLGLFFAISIGIYLLSGFLQKRITLGKMIWSGSGFILVMALALVLSNPLLLFPIERAEIIALQEKLLGEITAGYTIIQSQSLLQGGQFPGDLSLYFGSTIFVLLAIAGLVVGIIRKEKRLQHLTLLGFVFMLGASLLAATSRRLHYFIPILIPVFSALPNVFPDISELKNVSLFKKIIFGLCTSVLLAQAILFVITDYSLIHSQMEREKNAPAIILYNDLQQNVLNHLPETDLLVYRDWKIYFPASEHRRVEINWDRPDEAYIESLKPDIILLEMENVDTFSDPDTLDQAINSDRYPGIHQFYANAASGEIDGYCLARRNSFTMVFVADKWCANLTTP